MSLTSPFRHTRISAFTLVELLVVMAIIAVLASLTLGISQGVMNQAARKRALTEIAGMSTAMERYKTDNGAYPLQFDGSSYGPAPDGSKPNPADSSYTLASQALFTNLAGRATFSATPSSTAYMEFKKNQLNTNSTPNYIVDPWGYSYGYFITTNTASTVAQNGANFFDLWSTGGKTLNTAKNETNSWLTNWKPN
jgi:prepilin-type N-terminal cleavage/methylation domain-containing protein